MGHRSGHVPVEARLVRRDDAQPEPPARDPRLAALLALQRGAGNHAVSRLLDTRVLMRSPSPQDRRTFAEKWARLEEQLRSARRLHTADRKLVRELWQHADG